MSKQDPQDSSIHTVYERRYRTSQYFLDDQLRCSEAVNDFRSIKNLISRSQGFNVQHAFHFSPEMVPATIPIKSDEGN